MTSPRVSILVAVHDVEDFVEAAISSALAQTIQDIEVIVVDDGSNDASGDIAARMAANDARLKVIHQRNAGLGAARNKALSEAKGEWVAFLDGDDAFLPDFLETLLACAEATGADWAAGGVTFVMEDATLYRGPLSGSGQFTEPDHVESYADLSNWACLTDILTATWNKIYTRALLEDVRFDEGVWFEDYGFMANVFEKSDRLGVIDTPVIRHTRHRQGQITGSDDDRVFDHFAVVDALSETLANSNKPGAVAAMRRLSGRLLQERLPALKDLNRRTDFIAKAQESVSRHGSKLLPIFAHWLDHGPVLDVVIHSKTASSALTQTLHDLEQQAFQGFRVTLVSDEELDLPASGILDLHHKVQPGHGTAFGLNHGLALGQAPLVTFLNPGDRLTEWALWYWCDVVFREEADIGVTAYLSPDDDQPHSAIPADMDAVPNETAFKPDLEAIDPWGIHAPSLVFRRSHLQRHRLRFGSGQLSAWPICYLGLLLAENVVVLPKAGMTRGSGGDELDKDDRDLLHIIHRITDHLPPEMSKASFAAHALWRATANHTASFDLGAAWQIRMRYGRASDLSFEIAGLPRTVMTWPKAR